MTWLYMFSMHYMNRILGFLSQTMENSGERVWGILSGTMLGFGVWGLVALERELVAWVMWGQMAYSGARWFLVAITELSWPVLVPFLPVLLWKLRLSHSLHVRLFSGCFPPDLKAYKSFFPIWRSDDSPGPCLCRVTDKSIQSDSWLDWFFQWTELLVLAPGKLDLSWGWDMEGWGWPGKGWPKVGLLFSRRGWEGKLRI